MSSEKAVEVQDAGVRPKTIDLAAIEARRNAVAKELEEINAAYKNSLKAELDELLQSQDVIIYKAAVASMVDATTAVNKMRADNAKVRRYLEVCARLEGRASKGTRVSTGPREKHPHNVKFKSLNVDGANLHVTLVRIDKPEIVATTTTTLAKRLENKTAFALECIKAVPGVIFHEVSTVNTIARDIREGLKDLGLEN